MVGTRRQLTAPCGMLLGRFWSRPPAAREPDRPGLRRAARAPMRRGDRARWRV